MNARSAENKSSENLEEWKVLVVEDDEGLNTLVRKNLHRDGFDTFGAFDGEEAFDFLSKNRDTLVLLDYKLPDINGRDFIVELRKRGLDAPFIVMTGQGGEEIAVEMMKLGAKDYLIKETNILDYLSEVVARVIKEVSVERNLEKAEAALRESEEKYRTLMANLTEGVALVDAEENFNFANPAAERMFGVESSGLVGRNLAEFLSKSDFERVRRETKKRKSGISGSYDLTITRPDGQKRNLKLGVSPIFGPDGSFIGGLGTFSDVTERVAAEKKIRYLAKLVEGVSDAIISTDSDFKIASWNKAAERLYGWKAEEVIGKPLVEVLKTEYPDSPEKSNKDDLLNGDVDEVIQYCKDGRKIHTLPSVSFLMDPKDKTAGMVVVFHDITDRKIAEEKLRESYEQLRIVYDSVIDIIGKIVEVRDPYTAGHERRVAKLSVAIAKKLNLPKDQIDAIRTAAKVHDIGKIFIPSEILSKPGKLSKEEFELIKLHPTKGYEILEAIDFPWPIREIVLQHHERIDGSGYPNGIKGEEMLLEAKIIAVSDVVEAMSSHRPYRPAPGLEAALDEITQNRGKLYEPKVVDVCVELFREDSFSL